MERATTQQFNPSSAIETQIHNIEEIVIDEELYPPEAYTRRISRRGHEVLAADEEVELAKIIEAGVLAEQQKSEKNRLFESSLTDNEITRLIRQGKIAKDTMTSANQGLIHAVIEIHRTDHLAEYFDIPYEDQIQMGNVGLEEAIKRFDFTKGVKFSTYAWYWIRHEIQKGMAAELNVSRETVANMMTLWRVEDILRQKLNRLPNSEEIANYLHVPKRKIRRLQKNIDQLRQTRLDETDEHDEALYETTEDHSAPGEELAVANLENHGLEIALKKLKRIDALAYEAIRHCDLLGKTAKAAAIEIKQEVRSVEVARYRGRRTLKIIMGTDAVVSALPEGKSPRKIWDALIAIPREEYLTAPDLVEATGLARSTIDKFLGILIDRGLVRIRFQQKGKKKESEETRRVQYALTDKGRAVLLDFKYA